MNYAFMWLIWLAAGLFFIAAVTALAARAESSFHRKFWPWLVLIVSSVKVLGFSAILMYGLIYRVAPSWPVFFFTSMAVAYVIGALVVLGKGLAPAPNGPAARSWSRGGLAAVFFLSWCLSWTLFSLIDQDSRITLSGIHQSAAYKAIEIWPGKPLPSENAAEYYDQASREFIKEACFDMATDSTADLTKLPPWFEAVYFPEADFDPTSPDAVNFLEKQAGVLNLVRQGAEQPRLYYGINPNNLVGSRMPRFYNLKRLVKLVSLSARNKAKTGDIAGAFEELAIISRMIDQLLNIPQPMAVAVAFSLENLHFADLEYILDQASAFPDEPLPRPYNSTTSAVAYLKATIEYENAEESQSLGLLGQPWTWSLLGSEPRPVEYIYMLLWRDFYMSGDLGTVRQRAAVRDKITTRPFPQAVLSYKAALEDFGIEPQGPFAKIFGAGFNNFRHRAAQFDAQQRLALVALAAAHYRRDKGRYPAGFEDLVPEYLPAVPEDPFDLKPLKMDPLGQGLDLSSVGFTPQDEIERNLQVNPIHFYLGRDVYEEYRVREAREIRKKLEDQKKKKKK